MLIKIHSIKKKLERLFKYIFGYLLQIQNGVSRSSQL